MQCHVRSVCICFGYALFYNTLAMHVVMVNGMGCVDTPCCLGCKCGHESVYVMLMPRSFGLV